MNERELRAYALRGLTARLIELDHERASIVALLAELRGEVVETAEAIEAPAPREVPTPRRRTLSPEGRQRIAEAARQRWATHRASAPASSAHAHDAAGGPDADVARVLPRRGRLRREAPPTAPAADALPPMPRLVKANAS
jgi:hypothetical protein